MKFAQSPHIFLKIKKKLINKKAAFILYTNYCKEETSSRSLSGGQHMSQEKYIMAIDQGTTSSRAIIFNKKRRKG